MITLLIYILIFGLIVYAFNALIPLPAPVKTIFNVVIALVFLIWILNSFGGAPLRLR